MPRGSAPISMRSSTSTSISDRPTRAVTPSESCGLLDTSVVIDLDVIDSEGLPDTTAISAITFAELAAGPHATSDDDERGRRQDRLQWAGSIWDPLPCDGDVARAYGRIYATLKGTGRSSPASLRRSAHCSHRPRSCGFRCIRGIPETLPAWKASLTSTPCEAPPRGCAARWPVGLNNLGPPHETNEIVR